MARPAKAAALNSSKISKEDMEERKEREERVRGKADKLEPPEYLTKSQRKIFRYIVRNLEESQVLGNLDIYILSQAAISIDKLRQIDEYLNNSPGVTNMITAKSTREMYSKEFFRCCNELCLSPQSRAKLAIANVGDGKEKKKTIMDLLNEEDEE
ncbi:MAG: phage terminase small subunit P27 family [Lachnospiraceae bacterium]|nr:phage terminase small subunit P27 family [Lachnospiraceae bacterium]